MNKTKLLLATGLTIGLSACATMESYVESALSMPTSSGPVMSLYDPNQEEELYGDEEVVVEEPVQARRVRSETRVYEDQSFGINRYDEDALDDYIDGVKGVVQFLSAMQTPDSPAVMKGAMLLGLVQGQIRTAKIEIEEWPLAAREKAWEIQGSRITKYNELVNYEKDRILSNENYDAQFRRSISSIDLLNKETLLAE